MIIFLFALLSVFASAEIENVKITVNSQAEMDRLLKMVDTDNDKKITVDDLRSSSSQHRFWLEDLKAKKYEVSGIYFMSNLLQELKLSGREGGIHSARVFENPVWRTSRRIREVYWDGLTRRVDAENLAQVLEDSKIPKAEMRYLYVSESDKEGLAYFRKIAAEKPSLKVSVVELNEESRKNLKGKHGLLALGLEKTSKGVRGVPFVAPGGRFNEMYGWDSYFEALGLIADRRPELAKAMVDNFVYQIENYGKILNANRSYYLNRSQPPFLTSMIRAVWDVSVHDRVSKEWLARALRAAATEYVTVWTGPERLTDTGLSRYFGELTGIPPEVEPGHFDAVLVPAAKRLKISRDELIRRFDAGELKDEALTEFFQQDLAVRESGHDTTYRWQVNGQDRAADFVTVDLNSLLYKYELDLAYLIQKEFNGRLPLPKFVPKAAGTPPADLTKAPKPVEISRATQWKQRAAHRKSAMLKYLWDPAKKMFFDYNFKTKQRSSYVAATAFYPLWALEPSQPATRLLNDSDAQATVKNLLAEMEEMGGVAATSKNSLARAKGDKSARQWEYPNGWAPHQMIIWQGLKNYKQTVTADRLIYKWLYMITRNAADYNGTIPEKFDVVRRSHAVFAEYGNVGTQFSYITQEGFGWMNASYQAGLRDLSQKWRAPLAKLTPPEWLKFEAKD